MDPAVLRPVPRWLHIWAVATVVATALLLILGGFVTTFRVGMADPVWPTEPWYLFLISWSEPSRGFLIEHTHRLFGFLVGTLTAVLTLGVWWTEPRRRLRWLGLVGIGALLGAYGQFHGDLGKQADDPVVVWPIGIIVAMAVEAGVTAVVGIGSWMSGRKGAELRLLTLAALVGVMIQGLLGGFRVRFNALVGSDLAAVHGVFAQVVFSLLIIIAVLTAKPRPGPAIPPLAARKLRWQTLALVAFTFLQIVWGAWVRHMPGAVSGRMHLFFAFVVVGFATLTIKQALSDPDTRERLKVPAWFLMGLITLQVLLGVEAWMGKFFTGTLPELERITPGKAFVRTAHAHVGTWVLGVSVIFLLVCRRSPAVGPAARPSLDWQDADPRQVATGARSLS